MATDPARKQNLTQSELLFEEYLRTHGYSDFWRIPECTQKEPDYGVQFKNMVAVFEVKEFGGDPPAPGFGTFDQYGPVRRKIAKAAKQFSRYKDRPCCVVLSNDSSQLVMLDWPHVAGAMMGDLGFPRCGPIEPTFLGGEMVREDKNTRISATLILRKGVFVGPRMMIEAKRKQATLGRQLSLEEHIAILEHLRTEEKPSVQVLENPYASNKLPRDWFSGPYDERYGDGGGYGRIFVGRELAELERGSDLAGLR